MTLPERKAYGCTVCGPALLPSQTWVILLPHGNRRYRCEAHRENGRPVVIR